MPVWIDPAHPLSPWRAAVVTDLPTSGAVSAAHLHWRAVDDFWFAISDRTGGWVMATNDERHGICSALDRDVSDVERASLVRDFWRRGLVEVDGRNVVEGADWSAAIDETRSYYGLVLILNSGCNLACTYCYLGHSAPDRRNDIDLNIAQTTILAALDRPETQVILDFGEVAAATALFYELATFAERSAATLGKKLRIAIQTNATTLNDRLVDFLVERDAILGVSLDGPHDIHDKARPTRSGRGSHRTAVEALKRCRAAGLDFHLIVTVGAHNVGSASRVLDEIASMAPKTFLCKPILAHGEASTSWDDVGANSDDIAAFLANSVRRAAHDGLEMLDQSATKFLSRMIGESSGWRESCTSRDCGSGRNMHVLSARGELHACPRFVEPGKGRLATPKTVELVLQRKIDLVGDELHRQPETCKGCPWLRSCGGGCTLSGDPDFTPLPDPHCASYMAQHEALVDHILPELISGRLPIDGPLAGGRIRVSSEDVAPTPVRQSQS
ncbi:radical SAM additional 4Fe4S-binding SPASM domain-containing protein [Williamsia serinedens]|uniref:Radical SAM additional 4Fe4S-binding SPASM domain-containing protein n=1 Tax=Williamsia serinedens TaxID=391736 RepID=A0ABT1GWC3_9NOCA|nr:radical SAM additional 4Fe4S-binding SPASM domain-containing protein [Williamsia serinedens]